MPFSYEKTEDTPPKHFKPTFLTGVGGEGQNISKMTPPSCRVQIINLFVFLSILSRKGVCGSLLRGLCMERIWAGPNGLDVVVSRFCYWRVENTKCH